MIGHFFSSITHHMLSHKYLLTSFRLKCIVSDSHNTLSCVCACVRVFIKTSFQGYGIDTSSLGTVSLCQASNNLQHFLKPKTVPFHTLLKSLFCNQKQVLPVFASWFIVHLGFGSGEVHYILFLQRNLKHHI